MKDKIKAYYQQFKQDPLSQGIVIGGVISTTIFVVGGRYFGVNLDGKNVYIPDHIIEMIREKGPCLATKNGTVIVMGLVTEGQ